MKTRQCMIIYSLKKNGIFGIVGFKALDDIWANMGEIKFVLHHKEKKVLGIGSKKTEVQNRQLENGRESL